MPAHAVASGQQDTASPERGSLDVFFQPATVAVFGASESAGSVGVISRCGPLRTALTSGGRAAHVGCSAFVSLGSMSDVGWVDCIEYLGADPQTKQIGICLESMSGTSAFFEAVRKVALHKPV